MWRKIYDLNRDKFREFAVILSVLYIPSLLAQFLVGNGTGVIRVGESWQTVEQLARRIVRDFGPILLLLFFADGRNGGITLSRPSGNIKKDIPIGLCLFCGTRYLTWLAAEATGYLIRLDIAPHHWQQGSWILIVLVATLAGAALYEELLFRWYIITRLQQVGLPTWSAITASSLLFASWHIYEGTEGFQQTLIMGFTFALVFTWTKRIGPVVFAHFLVNFVICLEAGHA